MKNWVEVQTAWRGLEDIAKKFIEPIGEVRTIVEIGVDWGYSFFTFSRLFPQATVWGVDNWSYHDAQFARPHVQEWLEQFKNCRLLSMDSEQALHAFLDLSEDPIDVLHIDGDHTYEGVKRDFDAWTMAVRSGGAVLFHDVQSFPDAVGRFFRELPGEKKSVSVHAGLGVWYKP